VSDWRLRYQGARLPQLAALGDPRIFGLAILGLVVLAVVAGVAIAAAAAALTHIDVSHLGLGLMALGAGPMKAVDFREAALAKFKEAAAMEDADGAIPAEKKDEYDKTVEAAMELDAKAGDAAKREGTQSTVRDRISFYQQAATGSPMRFQAVAGDDSSNKTLGEQFIESDTYKSLVASGALKSRDQTFRTSAVSFSGRGGMLQIGAAAATDILHTDETSPTVAAPPRVRLPGIYGYGQQPLSVRDVFPNEGDPGGDVIEFVKQVSQNKASGDMTVKQSNAANDAAGLKKQSAFGTQVETAHAEIIATWFAATRKSLEQGQGLRSFIDNQGTYFLKLEEEDQLVNGDGTRPNLSGLLDQDERQHFDIHLTGGWDNLDALRHAKTMIRTGLSRLPGNFVLLNPNDSEGYDLLKNGINDYRGGNPIGGGFGDGEQPIWRLRRVETEAVAEGTALVGSRVMATVFQRAPIRILLADQHSDFFVRNLGVILFEEEIAFPIYFPTALVEVKLEDFANGS
jgi:hypothetical protein